jgi:hypothetical protein
MQPGFRLAPASAAALECRPSAARVDRSRGQAPAAKPRFLFRRSAPTPLLSAIRERPGLRLGSAIDLWRQDRFERAPRKRRELLGEEAARAGAAAPCSFLSFAVERTRR